MRFWPHNRRRVSRVALISGVVGLAIVVSAPAAFAAKAKTTRVNVSNGGAQAKGESGEPTVSKTGRYIAFASSASNLVVGDTNNVDDCFVRDQTAKSTKLVSVSSSGVQVNGPCDGPSISDDGNFVVWDTWATNIVAGDTNGVRDIFLRDRAAGTTIRVSISTGGGQGNADSKDPMISGNGRYIAFESLATNLVPGDNNGTWDVFVHDRIAGTTERVSVRSGGVQANGPSRDPDISADGRFAVFRSGASNMVANDTNGRADVFIHDRNTSKTSLISKKSNGTRAQGGTSTNPIVSATGRYVVFDSAARNLVNGDTNGKRDVFIRDRKLGKTKRVSVRNGGGQANGESMDPTVSDNGRRVAFSSLARNLVNGDTNGLEDTFVRNRKSGKTKRMSVRNDGRQARGGASDEAAISANGRFVVFESKATNLYWKDTNKKEDVFRRGPLY